MKKPKNDAHHDDMHHHNETELALHPILYVWRFYFFITSPLFCSHTYTYAHPSLSTTASLLYIFLGDDGDSNRKRIK